LNSPLNELRTQRRSRRKTPSFLIGSGGRNAFVGLLHFAGKVTLLNFQHAQPLTRPNFTNLQLLTDFVANIAVFNAPYLLAEKLTRYQF
jgi:hypothetical protein